MRDAPIKLKSEYRLPSNCIYFGRALVIFVPSFNIKPGDTLELKNSDLIISISSLSTLLEYKDIERGFSKMMLIFKEF